MLIITVLIFFSVFSIQVVPVLTAEHEMSME